MAQATAPILDSTKAEVTEAPTDVRCWINSRQHLLAVSISDFDRAPRRRESPVEEDSTQRVVD